LIISINFIIFLFIILLKIILFLYILFVSLHFFLKWLLLYIKIIEVKRLYFRMMRKILLFTIVKIIKVLKIVFFIHVNHIKFKIITEFKLIILNNVFLLKLYLRCFNLIIIMWLFICIILLYWYFLCNLMILGFYVLNTV